MTTTSWLRRTNPDGGLLLFRIRSVPVVLAPSWWIGSIVVTVLYTPMVGQLLPGVDGLGAFALAASFALLLGVSVLLHELGHCVVALRYGLPVRRLRLFLLGGISEVSRSPVKPAQEGMVAAAGPIVSIALAAVFGAAVFLVPDGGALWLLLLEVTLANAAVAVFNLLPGLPLDGGRMLRAAVWGLTGQRSTGTRTAVAGGGVVAVLLLLWALLRQVQGSTDRWLWLGVCVVTAWFVIAGARAELVAEQQRTWPPGLTLAELVRPVLQLPAESPVADALAAAEGRGVVLVRADGVAAGLLDEQEAQRLAAIAPLTPAERAADPIRPDTVLLDSDPGEEIIERVRTTAAWQFLVVDAEGRPAAVLRRQDLKAALSGRRKG
ncbi:site-2 protease family protein [Kutzneria viridogrisea]|uniref:Zinc metalloprotease n=2 Tax=Kutzneria TaxID=43356 RepID=W5W784_9PSEU|nr:site-2 protease family protein [Kutzneria albida]AHH96401.1 peptidase M50 [Kutzneria albida DSM 43870]MBA8928383.1 Zn-dependent protease [Kutzneria viridogrisea]